MQAIHPRHWLFCAGAFACAIGMAGSANAVTLPPGYGYVASQSAQTSVDAGVHQQHDSTTIGSDSASIATPGGTIGPGTASSSGFIAITPSPKISASTSVTFSTPPSAYNTSDGNYGSNAYYSGSLVYYFEIGGPTSSVAVNAKAVAAYSTSALPAGGNGIGAINFIVNQIDPLGYQSPTSIIRDSTTFAVGSYSAATAAKSGGFVENGTYSLLTNTLYQVGLQVVFNSAIVNTGVSDPSSTGGSATFLASLDPTFKVAPGVADPNGYSFVFSDGIGNTVSSTPLPAALPLFATGLGALGLLGARRKRKSPAPRAA